MRARATREVPKALRHSIRQAGDGFEIVTHYGYVLRRCATLDEARDFYAWHCPLV